MPFAEGYVLPVDKPLGWTSSDVVRKVKVLLRRLGHRKIKIGHAGTLDPLATGVLLVCIGRATKRAEELQAEQKEYLAGLELGATTPSFDREHPVDRYRYLIGRSSAWLYTAVLRHRNHYCDTVFHVLEERMDHPSCDLPDTSQLLRGKIYFRPLVQNVPETE